LELVEYVIKKLTSAIWVILQTLCDELASRIFV
jgi:hypothetical protein